MTSTALICWRTTLTLTGGSDWSTIKVIANEDGYLSCQCHLPNSSANGEMHGWAIKSGNGYDVIDYARKGEELTPFLPEPGVTYVHVAGPNYKGGSSWTGGTWKGCSYTIETVDPAKISINKSSTPSKVTAGDPVTYTITVTNSGGTASAAVPISDTFFTDGRLSESVFQNAGFTIQDGLLKTPPIPANSTKTFTYTYKTEEADIGYLQNTVSTPQDIHQKRSC